MKDFIKHYGLDTMSATEKSNISGWVTSVIVLSGLIGALTSSPFNDKLGRRWTLMIMAVI